MLAQPLISRVLPVVLLWGLAAQAQTSPKGGQAPNKSILERFDKNKDGKIDDEERRAVREKLKQRQNKPGALTPSGKTVTIGKRSVTEMEYASSDGRRIPCVLSMPEGDGPFPMLVTIHGGQGNRDLGYIRTMAAPNPISPTISAFNEQPWAILAISYRSGNGALFGKEHDDVIAGIRFAKGLPKIDPARVGVVGGSHGGHLALVAAEKMGSEFLCVAVGSPWMTDPLVYMAGDPGRPPLSLVPDQARDALVKNGRSLFNGLTRGRGMSDREARDFLARNSIEASADQIVIPTLFITSRGDDQAPHVLIEPMIERMRSAGKEVTVYTAEKSPHGFYWARTVSAARDLRGSKSPAEEQEEKTARETMITFFNKQFARTDARPGASGRGAGQCDNPPSKSSPASRGEQDNVGATGRGGTQTEAHPEPSAAPLAESSSTDSTTRRLGAKATRGRDAGLGDASFESLAEETGTISRDRFERHVASSPAFTTRPELADRLFDRLDTDGNGSLNREEYEGLARLRHQQGQRSAAGNRGMRRGTGRGNTKTPVPAPAAPAGENDENSRTRRKQRADGREKREVGTRTSPIQITSGELVGEECGKVRVFRGIPYAAPPTGELRWQAPQPPHGWTGVRDATQFGHASFQGETFYPRSEQSEDCLFLNVWTPIQAGPEAKLPVLFWIHGGAFIQGSGAQPRYDGTELAQRGIVVVSINYRLGTLGLFAHPALTAEAATSAPLGNLCLLDMLGALRWTRDNIAAFGGDAGNITISGSSAGGTSCLFLLGIPEADGLFHKAIIHSSGGIRNIQTLAQAEAAGQRLAEHLGLNNAVTAASLRRLPGSDLAISTTLLRKFDLPVKPIVDGRLVTRVPAETFAAGKQSRVPVLMGAANGESGARELGDDIATSGAFGFQVEHARHMAHVGQPVYLFQLTHVPPGSRANRHAAQHGESVAYAFGTIGQSTARQFGFRNEQTANRALNSRRGGGSGGVSGGGREDETLPVEDSAEGRRISAAMLDYWEAFMRTGRPEVVGRPTWPAFSESAPTAMVFGNHEIASRRFSLR